MDINNVTIIGRLTRDPELKYTQNGSPVVNFSIAVNGFKEDVSFLNVQAWSKVAESVGKYCKKGHRVCVSGRLNQKTWTDKDNNQKSDVEIVANTVQFLESKKNAEQEEEPF